MGTFVLTLTVVAAIMGVMAVGVVFSDRCLQGSCGGVSDDCACENAVAGSGDAPKAS